MYVSRITILFCRNLVGCGQHDAATTIPIVHQSFFGARPHNQPTSTDTGVSKQNGASYDADIWTRGGAVILYPTNGNFQITGSGGTVSPISTEAFGIRIKETKNSVNWFVRLTYMSATQINAVLAYDVQSGETPNSLITFQIEKTDGMGG